MSATVSSTMVGDFMRVTVKGAADGREARKLAQKAAGTAAVGSAVPRGKGVHVIDVSAKALAARKVVGSVPPAKALKAPAPVDALAAVLASLDPAVATVIRDALAAKAPQAPAKAPNTFVRDVIGKRAAAKASATCGTCLDYGVVRAGGKRKGEAYTTANGAAGAVNSAPCPSCKGSRKSA